jgi:hypothetical protein
MGVRLALLIGTKRYEDPTFAALQAPAADLTALAAVLRSPSICGFDYVQSMLDASASDARVALSMMLTRAAADDLVLVYFTGHGVLDEQGQLFFCLRDTQRALIRPTSMPASAMRDEMAYCRARRQVLILDCCHSGAFERTKNAGVGTRVCTEAHFRGSGRGRVVLASSDATQFAFEGDKVIGHSQQSLFTHYLIEGLQTGAADSNGDGEISVDEAYEYAYEKVTRDMPGQTPGKWTYKQQGAIVLAKNPQPVALPELIEPALIEGIAATKPLSIRLAAVAEMSKLLTGGRPGVALAARELLAPLAGDDSRRISSLVEQAWRASNLAPEPLPTSDAKTPPSPGSPAPSQPSPEVQPRASGPMSSISLLPAAIGARSAGEAPRSRLRRTIWGLSIAAAGLGCLAALYPGIAGTPSVRPAAAAPLTAALGQLGAAQRLKAYAAGIVGRIQTSPGSGAASTLADAGRVQSSTTLKLELGNGLEHARTFLVTDGMSEPIEQFPFERALEPAHQYQIVSYLGKKRLTKSVAFVADQREKLVRLLATDAWQLTSAPPAEAAQPSEPPKARLSVNGSPLTGVSGASLNGSLKRLHERMARCTDGVAAGTATFQLKIAGSGVVTSAMRRASSTLPVSTIACLSAVLKSGTYTPETEAGGAVEIYVSVTD